MNPITNFKSFLAKSYKFGLIFTLLFRSYTICSSYIDFHKEVCKLKDILQRNSFPLFVIDKCIHQFLTKMFSKSKTATEDGLKEVTVTIPFIGKLSKDVKNSLVTIFKKTAPHIKLKVMFVSNIRLKNCFSFKDRLPTDIQSLLLYLFKCDSCKAVYPGKTKRHYKVRLYEHLGLSFKTEETMKYNESLATAVRKHCHVHNHPNNVNSFRVVGRARNNFNLMIKESILLYRTGDCLNTAERSVPLQLFTK